MKRGKNNKAKLGADLLRKVRNAEAIVVANAPKPVRVSGKTLRFTATLISLNAMRVYILKTKVKNLNPKIIRGFSNIIKLIMSEYSYGQNIYHEAPSVDNAFIPENHKEKLQNEARKE
jgi:hypothetical protein